MLFVVGMAAVLWGIGAVMGTPKAMRWTLIGILYLAVLLMHFVLPAGHNLRVATGETAKPWLLLGGIFAIVFAYRTGLKALKQRAVPMQDAETPSTFREVELERYARHIVLREIGGPGQKKLKDAKVLVIGAGGLGCPALMYLAAAGVGTIGVVDDDLVDNSNLQRQVIHDDADIEVPKVHSAAASMRAQNPFVEVRPYHRRLTVADAPDLVSEYDVVLDGTDNFETRYLINRVCVKLNKPLISGALTQWEGQISVFDSANNTPCYQCIFPDAPAAYLAPNCAEAGVIGPLPGVIGAMMAVEAIKVITGAGLALRGEMQFYDALYGENRKIMLKKRPDCPVCGVQKTG